MLRIRNLQTYYGRIRVLDNVSLSVKPGEVVTLIGANGAGKSTILNCISRLIPCREGEIFFQGQKINGQPPEAVVRLGICQVPEGRQIFQPLTVLENLELGAYLRYGKRNRGSIQQDMDMVFSLFPVLAERLQQVSGTLSGGEQQMLAIGRALMTNPKLLILDEATEGLAPTIRAEIWAALARLKTANVGGGVGGGEAILIVDKTLKELMLLADDCVILERGATVWRGAPRGLDAAISDRYLGV